MQAARTLYFCQLFIFNMFFIRNTLPVERERCLRQWNKLMYGLCMCVRLSDEIVMGMTTVHKYGCVGYVHMINSADKRNDSLPY